MAREAAAKAQSGLTVKHKAELAAASRAAKASQEAAVAAAKRKVEQERAGSCRGQLRDLTAKAEKKHEAALAAAARAATAAQTAAVARAQAGCDTKMRELRVSMEAEQQRQQQRASDQLSKVRAEQLRAVGIRVTGGQSSSE